MHPKAWLVLRTLQNFEMGTNLSNEINNSFKSAYFKSEKRRLKSSVTKPDGNQFCQFHKFRQFCQFFKSCQFCQWFYDFEFWSPVYLISFRPFELWTKNWGIKWFKSTERSIKKPSGFQHFGLKNSFSNRFGNYSEGHSNWHWSFGLMN